MQFFIPFGDWSKDGHGQYETILVEAPSMESLLEAQNKIKEKYGKYFFSDYADQYDEPYFSATIWDALEDTKYPVERFKEKQDDIKWEECQSIAEVRKKFNEEQEQLNGEYYYEDSIPLTLETVQDTFIWLLNAFGAEIKVCEEYELIPMICNWTCSGFETVGYGCFY